MPVPRLGRNDDHVIGADLTHRVAVDLDPPATLGDVERLAERVRVPGSSGAGLEPDEATAEPRRVRRREQGADLDVPVKLDASPAKVSPEPARTMVRSAGTVASVCPTDADRASKTVASTGTAETAFGQPA